MQPEQRDLILKHFPQLVQECDFREIVDFLIENGELNGTIRSEISWEEDKCHNNRCILFKLLNLDNVNIFPALINALRHTNFHQLANGLENKPETVNGNNNLDELEMIVDVKLSTQFYDTEQYNKTQFYTTRSKNRGHVLIINNIKFSGLTAERHGAKADQSNLKRLFEKMGLTVFLYTNQNAHDMYFKAEQFAKNVPQFKPDMGIIIIMSHGLIVNNETMIVGVDNKFLPEDSFRTIFNNENCALFRDKPKMFIYHICRTVLKETVNRETMTDANTSETKRTYSDMLICHPSVDGYPAHRDAIKGSWYMQLLCKVFMNDAHDMDVESLLKKIDEQLEIVSSLPWKMEEGRSTQQTSTFQNIAFKKCYMHPGIYEENGNIVQLNQN